MTKNIEQDKTLKTFIRLNFIINIKITNHTFVILKLTFPQKSSLDWRLGIKLPFSSNSRTHSLGRVSGDLTMYRFLLFVFALLLSALVFAVGFSQDEGNYFGRNFENGANCPFFLLFFFKKTFLQLFVIILDCFSNQINACLFNQITSFYCLNYM